MINFIKRLFCKHDDSSKLLRWHWTHGINDNEPAFIESEWLCSNCGKKYFKYYRGNDAVRFSVNAKFLDIVDNANKVSKYLSDKFSNISINNSNDNSRDKDNNNKNSDYNKYGNGKV